MELMELMELLELLGAYRAYGAPLLCKGAGSNACMAAYQTFDVERLHWRLTLVQLCCFGTIACNF